MRWLDALLIGISQVFALIPGVSRSGSTITTGRLLSFDRQSAAVFSFLMSMPIIAAAVVLEGPKVLHGAMAPLAVHRRRARCGNQRLARDLDSDAIREPAQLRHLRALPGRARRRRAGDPLLAWLTSIVSTDIRRRSSPARAWVAGGRAPEIDALDPRRCSSAGG